MKLLLIDAHALIHRSYHAIERELTSPTGEPTKAVYGFASTLLKVIKDQQPTHVVATFDAGLSGRNEQFPEYKANRPPTPDDLRSQFARCQEFCAALNIPVFVVKGFEADDLIGTLSKQAEEKNLDTVILTGDRDTLQLVDDKTNVLMFIGYTGEIKLYDANAVQERFGFGPQQLIDFKALRGDTSDNIPGVAGVGDKTATKLIQEFSSVEGIYKHIGEIEGKVGDKLQAAQSQVQLNKTLVTIDRAAPVELDLNAAQFGEYDRARVVNLMRELGFKSLLDRIPGSTGETETLATESIASQIETNYAAVISETDLDALVKRIKKNKAFVVDVETTSIDPQRANLVGIAIGVGGGKRITFPSRKNMGTRKPNKKRNPRKGGWLKSKSSRRCLMQVSPRKQ